MYLAKKTGTVADIDFKLSVDDGNLNEKFDQFLRKSDGLQDSLDRVGDQGTQAVSKLATSLQNSLKTADAFRKRMEQNGQAIDRLRDLILFKQNALLRLEKQYNSFGKKSSYEAKRVKRAMDQLRVSIKEARLETKGLQNENKSLKSLGKQAEAAGDK